jgi:hypothetical protein
MTVRIDGLLLNDAAHLELSIFDREGEAPFDEVERVAAELLVAPAAEDAQVLAHARRERLQIVRARDQPWGDARFLGANLQQQLQQVGDKSAFLRQARTAGLTIGHFMLLERLCRLHGGDKPRSDIVRLPSG